jgi:alkylated DNA repair dioxygenase AlkB
MMFDFQYNLLPFGGELYYYRQLFSEAESELLYEELLSTINWRQEPIKMFGKSVLQPRLTALYGNEGVSYGYSGIRMPATLWTDTLMAIKHKIEQATQATFNVALLNRYRGGADSMGWHRDNEKELGNEPVIASLSFGAVRAFQVRPYKSKSTPITLHPESGSMLVMKGEMQQIWEHQLPKCKHPTCTRINITFRKVAMP